VAQFKYFVWNIHGVLRTAHFGTHCSPPPRSLL
jgi:hypothetical protein